MRYLIINFSNIIMKKIIIFLSIIAPFCAFSQNQKYSIPVSRLTEIMLEKNYSASDREELNKYPVKLKTLDYIYSKSFEISEHKPYTAEQFEKINIDKYNLTRKLDEYVLIFDEESGLPIVLYSLNKMENDKKSLSPTNAAQDNSSGKIAR